MRSQSSGTARAVMLAGYRADGTPGGDLANRMADVCWGQALASLAAKCLWRVVEEEWPLCLVAVRVAGVWRP